MSLHPMVHPRRFAALCAVAAVGLGMSFMQAGGAPAAYVAMNGAALLIGLLALGVIVDARRIVSLPAHLLSIILAALLLAVSMWGVSADGVTRPPSDGGLVLQPSLVLVPILVLGLVRSRDGLSILAVTIAAVALALQPDRAMAAALAAGLVPIAWAGRGRRELGALAVALIGLAITMIRPDPSPAMPFVDRILFTSFSVHPLAGLAVWCGAALMLVPAIAGFAGDRDQRLGWLAFGAIWLTVIVAAALGNYPTPLVGYGGSAILGYMLSIIALPPRINAKAIVSAEETNRFDADGAGTFRAGLA